MNTPNTAGRKKPWKSTVGNLLKLIKAGSRYFPFTAGHGKTALYSACPVTLVITYSTETKLNILRDLTNMERQGESGSLTRIAQQLGILPSTICKWRSNSTKLSQAKREGLAKYKKLHAGPKLKRGEVETALTNWVLEQRQYHLPITPKLMAAWVMKNYSGEFQNITACRQWIYAMLERNQLSIRRKTHNEKTSLTEHEIGAIMLDFICHIREMTIKYNIPYEFIINMDETGCHFDYDQNTTVAVKGSKHVNIISTGKPGKTVQNSFDKRNNGFDGRVVLCVQDSNSGRQPVANSYLC
ncbi:hypothetical protein HDV02_005666, partial [Globomyces sp. JEL0801]